MFMFMYYLYRPYRNGTGEVGTNWNHLGIEIRTDLVDNAMDLYVTKGNPEKRSNLYYLGCNFVHSIDAVMSTMNTFHDNSNINGVAVARNPILLSFQVNTKYYI